jgi:hypothetical protein
VSWLHRIFALLALFALAVGPPARAQEEPPSDDAKEEEVVLPQRLIERQPFDRITLNAANGNAVIEVVLLELQPRRVPEPLPTEGVLPLRRLSQPSIAYALDWSAIAKIELYEQVLLAEANRLTAAGQFVEAFEYLAFLQTNYPQLPGLAAAQDEHLWRDASAAFAAGNGEGAWPALLALYARNPTFPRLANAVGAVSDALIGARLASGNYAAARAVLDVVDKQFVDLELPGAAQWRQKFASDAREQLAAARAAIDAGDYDAARAAAVFADAIVPGSAEARALLQEIQRVSPEIRVGVTQRGAATQTSRAPDWAAARVSRLTDPPLVEMTAFGAEGGEYATRFGEIATDASGMNTTLTLQPGAQTRGVSADAVARELFKLAEPQSGAGRSDFAALLAELSIAGGSEVHIAWRRPHLHPEAFLQLSLRGLASSGQATGLWFEPLRIEQDASATRYARTQTAEGVGGPQSIIERVYADEDATLAALAEGEIDAVDRVPPWLLDEAGRTSGVVVGEYRLPTVHVLIPNFDNPFLAMREFRRALCYGTDREGVVNDVLLGGEPKPGFVVLSGPFPAGVGLGDPVGYAYNSDIAPRPYEPRLASLLAGVARATHAKRDLEERKRRGEEIPPVDPTVEPEPPKAEPLVLAHAADPMARLACQAIKLQLDQVNIPIKLVELPADDPTANVKWDLLYAELAICEPLVDARRILGTGGVAPRTSALMTAAINQLDRAANWNEARERLQQLHQLAHDELPVIPLWQTVNHFARRSWLASVAEEPITLYQNVENWRKSFE